MATLEGWSTKRVSTNYVSTSRVLFPAWACEKVFSDFGTEGFRRFPPALTTG